MTSNIIIQMLLNGIGGLGIFLLGMNYMSTGMQAIAGKKLRQLIHLITNNRFIAYTVGILITSIIQSSSVTTVMCVGFVNSGLMTLTQAIGVILGSNIGTTITGWMLALNISKYGLVIIGIFSIIYIFSKNEKVRNISFSFLGIGMIFFGLTVMSDGFKPMTQIPEFINLFSIFQANSYFGIIKCVILGAVVTAVVQSSSATIGITIGLATAGLLDFNSAAALVMGENLGTTITSFFASIGVSANAKRAAYAHMIFNALGSFYMIIIFPYYIRLITFIIGNDPNLFLIIDGEKTYPHIIKAIALSHTLFNLINSLLFLPFIKYYAKFITFLVPEKKEPDMISKVKMSLNKALVEPESALEVVELECINLFEIICEYSKIVQNPVNNAEKLKIKNTYKEISAVIHNFLISLMEKDMSFHATERLINILKRLDMYNSLESNVFNFINILKNNNSEYFNVMFNKFYESMDLILLTAFDTIKSKDKNDIIILNNLTAAKSKIMSDIRFKMNTEAIDLSTEEKSNLLQITNLFELNIWLINNICKLLTDAAHIN